jgi:carboxymethylenebutenolidase
MIDIKTPDGVADAYLSRPDDGAAHPGVLLIIDAFGLRQVIEQMADRIAARGFVVLAPNFFYRGGRAPVFELPDLATADRQALMAKIGPLMGALTPEVVASDGLAYLDALAQYSSGPIAITGYCMGVRVGWRIAGAYPDRVAALGGFHGGGLVTDDPDSPHLSAGSLSAELYLGHADQDASMTPEHIAALERALEEAGVTYISEIYEGASHGYTMADTPVYNEAAAERHFDALFGLLDRTVV